MSLISWNLFAPPPDPMTHDGRDGKGAPSPYETLSKCAYPPDDNKAKQICEDRLKKEFQKYSGDPHYYDCEVNHTYHPDVTAARLMCRKR